ncbi:hypothetical protein [Paraclostridium sp. AKS73]|uniref:hypothetical protein n=1 Tax=Paraclostridium sp. AKS73 TaxID=2876116 RepID=UPI0021E08779|nr:hypothetical protein [Paraclostridium sp. AKS73]MCU9815094.1 hypothetical protein [Paraclostridium sp. AKS73]
MAKKRKIKKRVIILIGIIVFSLYMQVHIFISQNNKKVVNLLKFKIKVQNPIIKL